MKKSIFLIAAFICFTVNLKAQQGDVIVKNNSNCNIAFDVVATCPRTCQSMGSLMMTVVGPGQSTTIPAGQYPFNGGDGSLPPCSDWEWHFADIFVCGNYYMIGRDVNGCHPAGLSGGLLLPNSPECDCGPVVLGFSIQMPGGNVVITAN